MAATNEGNGIDKLTDDMGNFALQMLPYKENFLEPFMDEETVHLHYTFHHGTLTFFDRIPNGLCC